MELRGAKIINFYGITLPVSTSDPSSKDTGSVLIPVYQRPYTWKAENVSQLINDWHEVGGKYFAGSIVSVLPKGSKRSEIVDGQQRYTTLFLVNYLIFNMLRVDVREKVTADDAFGFPESVSKLKFAFNYLFAPNNKAPSKFIKNIEKLSILFKDSHKTSKKIPNLKELLMFPKIPESNPDYDQQYQKLQLELLESQELFISYGRETIYEELTSSLSSAVLKMSTGSPMTLSFTNNPNDNDAYKLALKTIFDTFNRDKYSIMDPSKSAQSMIEDYSKFIKETQLCVIQTPSSDDAYTLFEVLNDRSSLLSDLDLVKNQFYKEICGSFPGNKTALSDLMASLDNQWSEKIFKEHDDVNKNKLISYLSASFLTGDSNLDNNKNTRASLKVFLKNTKPLDEKTARRIFNVYESASIFIDVFDIHFGRKNEKAFKTEFDLTKTYIYKLVHLLVALKLEGVLVAVFSILLKQIEENHSDFDPKDVEAQLKSFCGNKTIATGHKEIDNMALDMWNLVMAHEGYKAPRERAKILAKDNNYPSSGVNLHKRSITFIDIDSLEEWLGSWRYKPDKALKVKIILARLIQLQHDASGHLCRTPFSSSTAGKLHLDHMEPEIPKSAHKDSYFQSPERSDYVNGLGNMMLLPDTINTAKQNDPMYTIKVHLDKAGLPASACYLTKDIESLLTKYSKLVKGHPVPTEKFFETRKKLLIGQIVELVKLPI